MKKYIFIGSICLFISTSIFAQKDRVEDSTKLRQIFDIALTQGKAYDWLDYLSNEIGGRLSGSIEAELAVQYTKEQLETLGLSKVYLQPVMVPKWTRGIKEYAYIETAPGETSLADICALGGSVATIEGGLKAEVVEVQNFEELATLGKEKIQGKIVFFNRAFDQKLISTGAAYGGAVDQRYSGAEQAAKYGAVGVVVRTMGSRQDDFPHTGAMSYGKLPESQQIPACAISTNGASYLSAALKLKPDLKFYFRQTCKTWPDAQSYNVIGEITGSKYPNKYITVGGHLDSWDMADGSHDDGAGVVHSMEVVNILKEIGYKPNYSIRVVLFMNEENGLAGGNKYAEMAKKNNEDHVFALESDSGGFTPRGFSFDADNDDFQKIKSWSTLFEPYLTNNFVMGHSGADIGPLKHEGMVLAGLNPDSQRYFDYHHSALDTFDKVNKRELQLGAAAMASLVYLFDKYEMK